VNKRLGLLSLLVFSVLFVHTVGYGAELFEVALRTVADKPEDKIQGSLGLGAYLTTQPYIDRDENVYPVPIVVLRYKKFYMDGTSFGYVFNDDENIELSVVGQPRLMGYEAEDSSALTGMEDRDWSLDGGLRATWKGELFRMNITGLTDLLNNHQGQEISAVFSKEFLMLATIKGSSIVSSKE